MNALADQCTRRDVTDRATAITAAHVESAKETLIQERCTHLGEAKLKVLDFGIAKVSAEGKQATATMQGGSPQYMAPEQTERDGQIGPATDVWAFGLIAFRLLVGHTYWHGDDGARIFGELFTRTYAPATQRALGVRLTDLFSGH